VAGSGAILRSYRKLGVSAEYRAGSRRSKRAAELQTALPAAIP
jgi:hypothetical protein